MKGIWRWSLFLLSLLAFGPGSALAGEPSDRIKDSTDKIIAVVSNPDLKAPERSAERKKLIRKAVDERFDWEEMSRRTLARHWAGRTVEEKKQFIDLFGRLLERTYLDKVEGYSGEKVVYLGDQVEEPYAVVNVKIITQQGTEIPVMYRCKKKGDWLVYDISIEGVSLINNYRTQFGAILAKSSFQGLLDKIKAKLEQE